MTTHSHIEDPDVLLIGSGIMSATLAAMLKNLNPALKVQLYEAANSLSPEASDGWHNAGTGHAALDPAMPHGLAIVTLLGVGIVSTVSHLFISLALRFAPAATIAPLQYLEIVAATALGYFIFSDIPDALTVLGIFIIVGAGLYVFARERKADQQLAVQTDVPHTP